ncbi:MAG TPA: hypothetical protein VN622_12210 [Clostridia bacterium]|nr:hypothetical protein [Clostridia bacterium]
MKTIASILLLAVVLGASSCDGVFVGGFTSANSRVGFATGSVSIVRLTVIDGHTDITFVTLINAGTARDFNFCGDISNQFLLNSFVNVNFVPGTTCDSHVVVVVV